MTPSSLANSFARYGYGATELIGLKPDINNSIAVTYRAHSADTSADPTSVANGMGVILGMVNDNFHTDLFD